MNIYTIHSESHQILFELLQNSLNHPINSRIIGQISKNTDYGSDEVKKFYFIKILYILEILTKETKPFLFLDTDIYVFRDFIKDIEKRLSDNDILAQYEKKQFGLDTICTGIMLIRPNERTKKAFLWVLKNLHRFVSDQSALNFYLKTHRIKCAILPKEYYSINYDNGDKVWNGEAVEVTVRNPFLIHLHWTLGMDNRLKLLAMVKNKIAVY